jgi:membrane protease YdiL (CAAX protease family)
MTAAAASVPVHDQRYIAPIWHTIGLLILLSVPIVRGIYQQSFGSPNSQIFSSHSQVFVRFYIPVLIYEWVLAAYVYWGIRRSGMTVRELIGGRWARATDLLRDLGLGIGFLVAGVLCMSVIIHLLGPGHAKAINVILPQGGRELAVWVVISLTAGFVEELVYRGYLQTQFSRFGMPVALAIMTQAVIFGAGHAYEGWQKAVAITFFAIFAGVVAVWRRSLRPNMIGHAMMDLLAAVTRTA